MTLHAIVSALGGDLYHGGQRANIPAPGHSAADRSISLLLSEGRVVAYGFGAADWRTVLDDLRRRGLIDAAGRPSAGDGLTGLSAPTRRDRVAVAEALWAGASPITTACLAARYARMRSIRADLGRSTALRIHPAAPLSVYRPAGRTRPALVAAIHDPAGELTAVELTYLDPNGRRATGLRLPRKTVGLLPPGCAVRLAEAGHEFLVGEGVFTTLSAMETFDLPGWALLSANNLFRWTPPAGVRSVLVAGDRGAVGERSAARLATRLGAVGVPVVVQLPPPPFGDWNEAASARAAPKAEREGAEGCRDGGDGPRSARPETAPCPRSL